MTMYLCSVCGAVHSSAEPVCPQTFSFSLLNEPPISGFYRTETMRSSVIFIGTDGVGKTPIATQVAKHYGLPYFKFANELGALKGDGHPGQHMLWFDYGLTQVMTQTGLRIVSDRGYPCELVYSRYFGRQTNYDLFCAIDRAHRDLGTVIVWMHDSQIEKYPKDDPHVDKGDIPKIQLEYQQFVDLTLCDVVSYDMSTSALCETWNDRLKIDVPNVIQLIDRKIKERKR